MKTIHRKILRQTVAKFDKMLTQVEHWKGHHQKSWRNHPADVCKNLQEIYEPGVTPINKVPQAKRLSPARKAKILRICEYNYITYGNDFDFKYLYLRELGYKVDSRLSLL